MRGVAVWLVLLLFGGCSSAAMRMSDVDITDGVDRREAVTLAADRLRVSPERARFSAGGEILFDYFVKSYPGFWFVQFPARRFDDSFWKYLVVIKKSTGDVVHEGPYVPLQVKDYDWVFSR